MYSIEEHVQPTNQHLRLHNNLAQPSLSPTPHLSDHLHHRRHHTTQLIFNQQITSLNPKQEDKMVVPGRRSRPNQRVSPPPSTSEKTEDASVLSQGRTTPSGPSDISPAVPVYVSLSSRAYNKLGSNCLCVQIS